MTPQGIDLKEFFGEKAYQDINDLSLLPFIESLCERIRETTLEQFDSYNPPQHLWSKNKIRIESERQQRQTEKQNDH